MLGEAVFLSNAAALGEQQVGIAIFTFDHPVCLGQGF